MSHVQSAAFGARPADAIDEDIFEDGIPLPAGDAAQGAVRLAVVTDLAAAEHEWRAFETTADCTAFQSFAWLSTWFRHVGARAGVQPAVVVVRSPGGETRMILPLMIERAAGLRRLRWLGSDLCDYNAPLLAPGFDCDPAPMPFATIWRDVQAQLRAAGLGFDLIALEKMPETVGGQPNPFMQLRSAEHPSRAYRTALTGDWESFYKAKRSGTTHRRDRTKRKKLGEIGEVRFVTPQSQDEALKSLQILMAQKSAQFASMGVPNIFLRPGWADFYRALAADPVGRDMVHISRLDVGAAWAAVNLGLVHRGCYYHVLASYDAGPVSKFGPGSAHLHELIAHAIGQGCSTFDFTIGDEAYKRDWSDTVLVLHDHVAAATWRGALAVAPLAARRTLKRWIKHTPVLWRAASRLRELCARLRG